MPSVRAPQQMAPARPSRGCRFVQTPSQQGGGSRVGGRRLRHARHSSPTSSAPAKHRDRLLTVTPDPGATHARTPRCPLRSCLYMSTTAALTPSCAFCVILTEIHQRYIRIQNHETCILDGIHAGYNLKCIPRMLSRTSGVLSIPGTLPPSYT